MGIFSHQCIFGKCSHLILPCWILTIIFHNESIAYNIYDSMGLSHHYIKLCYKTRHLFLIERILNKKLIFDIFKRSQWIKNALLHYRIDCITPTEYAFFRAININVGWFDWNGIQPTSSNRLWFPHFTRFNPLPSSVS